MSSRSTQYDSFRVVIKQSLCELPQLAGELFRSLTIFGDNVKIPLSLLQRYWDMTEAKVQEMVRKFDRLYLVETVVMQQQVFCSLQYHYSSYLSHEVSEEKKRLMHRKLVDCYK